MNDQHLVILMTSVVASEANLAANRVCHGEANKAIV